MSDKPRPGETVILLAVPDFLDELDEEDQRAIEAMVGKPVTFVGFSEGGQAEVRFDDPFHPRTGKSSYTHALWVDPESIRRL